MSEKKSMIGTRMCPHSYIPMQDQGDISNFKFAYCTVTRKFTCVTCISKVREKDSLSLLRCSLAGEQHQRIAVKGTTFNQITTPTLRRAFMFGVILGDFVISSMKSVSIVGPARREMDLSKVAGHGLSNSSIVSEKPLNSLLVVVLLVGSGLSKSPSSSTMSSFSVGGMRGVSSETPSCCMFDFFVY